MRKAIGMGMPPMDIIVEMSEGNPGAFTVLGEMMQSKGLEAFMAVLSLDDMNIRGTQIWAGFKYYCNQDLDLFIEKVKSRDKDMVELINKECLCGGLTEVAVISGASFLR